MCDDLAGGRKIDIIMIFGTKLLIDRGDVRMNNNFVGGMKVNQVDRYGRRIQSYRRDQLYQFIDENEAVFCSASNEGDDITRNEFVFDDDIPIEPYLKEIWVCPTRAKLVRQMLNNNSLSGVDIHATDDVGRRG